MVSYTATEQRYGDRLYSLYFPMFCFYHFLVDMLKAYCSITHSFNTYLTYAQQAAQIEMRK